VSNASTQIFFYYLVIKFFWHCFSPLYSNSILFVIFNIRSARDCTGRSLCSICPVLALEEPC
jgi:hypothetical protein